MLHFNTKFLPYEKGIQLIHIYDFDWLYNNEKIKNQLIELFNGNDCSKYNWIPVNEYKNYTLSEPIKKYLNNNFNDEAPKNIIYLEGNFIKKYKKINMEDVTNISIEDKNYKKYKKAYEYALDMTIKEVNQSIEGLFHKQIVA